MIKTNKKQVIISLALTILLLAFLSFSYFLINASNENKENLVSKTATLDIKYTDCMESTSDCANINKNLELGESVTKTFKVENNGSITTGFEIIFKSLENTFVDNELVYKVLDENNNILVDEKPVPYGISEGTTIFSDSIRSGQSKNYKMVIIFKEMEYDQEKNKNAEYDIELGIKTDSTIVSRSTLNKIQSLNSDIVVKSVTPNFANISPMPSKYKDNGIAESEEIYTPVNNEYYITYGDDYIFNETTGKYTLTNPKICKWNECYSELTNKYYCYNALYNNSSLHNYSNRGSLYKITSNSTDKKIYYKKNLKEITEYDYKDSGLFQSEDDYGESLYFRGDITNNYVKFGKNKSGQDMYWRILRINGDGTLRIEYDGTSPHENGEASKDRAVGLSKFNDFDHDNGYIGFMYGTFPTPTGCECTSLNNVGTCIYTCTGGGSTSYEDAHLNVNDSTIKKYLEEWYDENIIATGYESYISDELFCNDRNVSNNGYGMKITTYSIRNRLETDKEPTLFCSHKNDSFTVSDSVKGNAKLKYPIGLMSADELTFSGLTFNGESNKKIYTFHGDYYSWTMSPNAFYDGRTDLIYHTSTLGGGLRDINSNYVIPVINLTSEYVQTFTGDGTMNNPFQGE